MSFIRAKNFIMVELVVGTGVSSNNSKVYFQTQAQLQSYNIEGQRVYIKCIETYSNNAITSSPLSTGNPVAAPADIQNGVLTLVENGTENKMMIPLARLNNIWPSTGGSIPPSQPPLLFKNFFTTDWTKSYVTVITTAVIRPFSYLFGVYYDYEPDLEDVMIAQERAKLDILEMQRQATYNAMQGQ